MKFLFYAGIVLVLVPLQATILPHLSVWEVKPNAGLVVAAVIGLLVGEIDGLAVGLAIGWVLNMYSAGDLWLSLVTTGGAGLLAGLVGRHVAQVNPTVLCVGLLALSFVTGVVTAMITKSETVSDTWWMVQSVVLPQAIFDAAVGTGLFWIVRQRLMSEWMRGYERY